jgi:hypothetical protein
MVEYSVILKRFKGSARPDVCIFRDESRDAAIREMRRYCKQYGFTVEDHDGRHTIAGIHLVAKEPIAGAPVLSEMRYLDVLDIYDNILPAPA